MAHTFSSLSPKHQASAIVESKNLLKVVGGHLADCTDDQSYINPFSIACRKDSDQNTEGEVTAEGFYKIPDAPMITSARAEMDPVSLIKHKSGES